MSELILNTGTITIIIINKDNWNRTSLVYNCGTGPSEIFSYSAERFEVWLTRHKKGWWAAAHWSTWMIVFPFLLLLQSLIAFLPRRYLCSSLAWSPVIPHCCCGKNYGLFSKSIDNYELPIWKPKHRWCHRDDITRLSAYMFCSWFLPLCQSPYMVRMLDWVESPGKKVAVPPFMTSSYAAGFRAQYLWAQWTEWLIGLQVAMKCCPGPAHSTI